VAFQLKIKTPDGAMATLTAEQFKLVESTVVSMMNGKLSLKAANAAIIQKLEDAGMPIQFEAPPCNTEPE
jgi:hypothetical protein